MISLHKLGKKPATYDKRDLQFAHYRTAAPLPTYPKQFGHEKLVAANAWQMLGNGPNNTVSPGFQGAGDCVFAGEITKRCSGLWKLAVLRNSPGPPRSPITPR